jgi:NadR type nicotinamide-nucleotide adenylyltransferase
MTEESVTRIVVIGSESTGKTTLAHELATHFGALWVTEQSRVYAERVKRALTAEDVSPIASEQIAAEDAQLADALRRKVRWLFLDTDLVSTVVYARHYYGTCPAWIEAEARARLAELYLVADVDIPWAADSVRDRPESRDELHLAFQAVLTEFNARKCLVRGLGESRFAAAVRCIERLET